MVLDSSGAGRSLKVHALTIGSTRTAGGGSFSLSVRPGTYLIAGVRPGGSVCGGQLVVVRAHTQTRLQLGCGK